MHLINHTKYSLLQLLSIIIITAKLLEKCIIWRKDANILPQALAWNSWSTSFHLQILPLAQYTWAKHVWIYPTCMHTYLCKCSDVYYTQTKNAYIHTHRHIPWKKLSHESRRKSQIKKIINKINFYAYVISSYFTAFLYFL